MIDLHVHSNISDGADTPTEVIKKAKNKGLRAIALTDHDNIEGLEEAKEAAKRLEIDFVKGIELTVSFGEDRLIHILGLGIDTKAEGFMKPYITLRRNRDAQIGHTIDRLRNLGIKVTADDLQPFSYDGYLDRMAAAKWLVAKGHTSNLASSWVDVIDHFPYVEGENLECQIALDMIHAAGGYSFLAHFHKNIGLRGYDERTCLDKLEVLKRMGLDGLEAYYPTYDQAHQKKIASYIKTYDFLMSGGSDYHGSNRPGIELGVGAGDFHVPDEVYESLF